MSLITPIEIDKEAVKIHIPIALIASIIILCMGLGILGSTKGFIDRKDGVILILLFIAYFIYPIITEIKDIAKTYKENKKLHQKQGGNVLLSILLIIVGVVLLKYGGDFVVDYATNIAEQFGISERVIGLTIVAIGTAMPEIITSIIAVIKKDTDLAVGNLVGSCVLNIFLILGVGAVITPLEFSESFNSNLILLVISTFIIWLFNFIGKKHTITRAKGAILLLIFAGYIVKLFI